MTIRDIKPELERARRKRQQREQGGGDLPDPDLIEFNEK